MFKKNQPGSKAFAELLKLECYEDTWVWTLGNLGVQYKNTMPLSAGGYKRYGGHLKLYELYKELGILIHDNYTFRFATVSFIFENRDPTMPLIILLPYFRY